MRRTILHAALVCLLATAQAQVPGTLSYQGILVNSSGVPVSDISHQIAFNFYTTPTGGNAIGSLSRGPFPLTPYKGMLTFLIGSGTPAGNDPFPLDASHPGNNQYYVEVLVNGTALPTRVQLSSVPYAFRAYDANQVVNGTIGGSTSINTTGNIATTGNLEIANSSTFKGPVGLGSMTNVGTAGQVFTSQGNSAPTWTTPSGESGNSWGLTGNADTDAASFIGTTNNVPLNFGVNGTRAGKVDQTEASTFLGFAAGNAAPGGDFNTGVGHQTLMLNTDGTSNTAMGSFALTGNTTGSSNTAIGYESMMTNVAGASAVAIGYRALKFTSNAGSGFTNQNVAVGYEALAGSTTPANNTGNFNSVLGFQAMTNNSTGASNTAVGGSAMLANTVGFGNSALGERALQGNTAGSGNVANGFASMYDNTIGNNNVAIGYQSLGGALAGSDATAVGAQAMQYTNSTATPFSNSNVAVGFQSLRGSSTPSANTGTQNSALGYQSLAGNTTGSTNTALGHLALTANTTGASNVAIGSFSGYTTTPTNANVSGSNNTFLGHNSGPSTPTQLNNAVAIGANATVGQSNAIALGATGARVGIGTGTPFTSLHVVGDGINDNSGDIFAETNMAAGQSSMSMRRSQGTYLAPTSVQIGDQLGRINFFGHTGSAYALAAQFGAEAETTFSTSANAALKFSTMLNGTLTERMRINSAGNVQIPAANEYSYTTPKTKYLSISNSAFEVTGTNTAVFAVHNVVSGNTTLVRTSGGTLGVAISLAAPLQIPDGATVTEMVAYAHDNDGSNDLTVRLVRQQLGTTSFASMATVTSSGAPTATILTASSISNPAIDQSAYNYQIIFVTTEGNANLGLYAVRIAYTVTKAD